PVGTARYISPEQAGLLNLDVDERSDLYSAGIVLFECLAGQPPFQGSSVTEVLRQHMTVRPPELRRLGVQVPQAVEEVIQHLLRKDPRDRYQSAAAVLFDLRAIAGALERGEPDPVVVVGLHDRRRTLTEPAFVGRKVELAALEAQVERACEGQGGLTLLESASGDGKTRLLDELAQRHARQGVWVLRGQGLNQAAQRPFQVLAGVVAEVIEAGRAQPELAHSLQEHLGDQREAVCAALPELAEILGAATAQTLGPEAFGENRTLQALAALVDGLGAAARPALVLLDDCQWADELTLKLLGHWQRRQLTQNGHSHPVHVALVAACRSEELPADLLRLLQPTAHVVLPPFQTPDVRRLAESMAGRLPEEVLDLVERLSEGSPFMASAILRGLVECGALVDEPGGWRVEPLALANVQSSHHAAAFLARRLELLPPEALPLLSVGAVLGKTFDLDFAAALARQAPSQAISALDEARRRHLVWARAPGTSCTFVHDKIREALLARLTPEERRHLHHQAAQYLEEKRPQEIFDLAYHFDAAGESERALPHALAAARRARGQHLLEMAEQQYRIAERGARHADNPTRFGIAEGLGDVLLLRGRYEEAARQLETARPLAETPFAQAQIEGKLGELAFKRGDVRTAGETIERALRRLGRWVPRGFGMCCLSLLWEVSIQSLHTWFPKLFLGRRPLKGAEEDLLAVRLHSRLGYTYWFTLGNLATLWTHLREMNLAECYPPTPELAQVYSEHAPVMSLIPPLFRRGIRYAEKSLAIRRQFGDLWGQGQTLHFHGLVLYAASQFAEGNSRCREAVRLLERMGDVWEMNIARFQIAFNLYRLGELKAAAEESRAAHQLGLELGDMQASAIGLDIWAKATGGRVPLEKIQVELQRPRGDVQSTAHVLQAEGVRLLGEGRHAEAAAVFQKGWDQCRQAGVKNAYTLPLLAWLATALRLQAEAVPAWVPNQRLALLRRARATARQGLRWARRYQNDLPHCLRECGLLAALAGKPRRARRLLDQSLDVARRQAARFEHAQTLLARGRLGLYLGWPNAAADVTTARQALRALGADFALDQNAAGEAAPATLALADRFATVLEAGRHIASALSREAIYAAVREAALRLLRGERCLILKIVREGEREDLTTVSGEVDGDYSRAMAHKALATGRIIVFLEGMTGDASESVLMAGVRSALCAPFSMRGQATGCIYVTHRQVGGLFGEEEERLAEFIATLAGAALENAEGFAELRRLNETLEQRVAERTAVAEAHARNLAHANAELKKEITERQRAEEELRQAKEAAEAAREAAEAANRAKSQFLANM
ncbi:MAG: AAA family ATPase, partial [Planctomycetes bacterium]|nr:AAA family ATPase [Planctomycetota bacterium]